MRIIKIVLIFISFALLSSNCFANDPKCTTIGILGEFTQPTNGYDRFLGKDIYQGAEIALAQIKEQQPNTCIILKKLDTENTLASIPGLIDQAAKQNIHLFIGMAISDQAIMAIDELRKTHSILLSPTATANELSTSKRIITFFPSNNIIAEAIANYLLDHKIYKVATVYNMDSFYSTEMSGIFNAEFKKLGGAVPLTISLSSNNLSLSPYAAQLKKANIQYIFLPMFDLDAAKTVIEVQRAGFDFAFMGTEAWNSYSLRAQKLMQAHKLDKPIDAVIPMMYSISMQNDKNAYFMQHFIKLYHKNPTDMEAFSFDAMNVAAAMLNVCSTSEISNNPEQCLQKILPIDTTSGTVTSVNDLALNRPIFFKNITMGNE